MQPAFAPIPHNYSQVQAPRGGGSATTAAGLGRHQDQTDYPILDNDDAYNQSLYYHNQRHSAAGLWQQFGGHGHHVPQDGSQTVGPGTGLPRRRTLSSSYALMNTGPGGPACPPPAATLPTLDMATSGVLQAGVPQGLVGMGVGGQPPLPPPQGLTQPLPPGFQGPPSNVPPRPPMGSQSAVLGPSEPPVSLARTTPSYPGQSAILRPSQPPVHPFPVPPIHQHQQQQQQPPPPPHPVAPVPPSSWAPQRSHSRATSNPPSSHPAPPPPPPSFTAGPGGLRHPDFSATAEGDESMSQYSRVAPAPQPLPQRSGSLRSLQGKPVVMKRRSLQESLEQIKEQMQLPDTLVKKVQKEVSRQSDKASPSAARGMSPKSRARPQSSIGYHHHHHTPPRGSQGGSLSHDRPQSASVMGSSFRQAHSPADDFQPPTAQQGGYIAAAGPTNHHTSSVGRNSGGMVSGSSQGGHSRPPISITPRSSSRNAQPYQPRTDPRDCLPAEDVASEAEAQLQQTRNLLTLKTLELQTANSVQADLKSQLQSKDSLVADLEVQVTELRSKAKVIQSENAKWKHILSDVGNNPDACMDEITKLNEAKMNLVKQVESLEKEMEKRDEQVATLEKCVASLKPCSPATEQDVRSVPATLLYDLQSRVQQSMSDNKVLRARVASLQTVVEEKARYISGQRLPALNEELEAHLTEARADNETLLRSQADMEKRIFELERCVEERDPKVVKEHVGRQMEAEIRKRISHIEERARREVRDHEVKALQEHHDEELVALKDTLEADMHQERDEFRTHIERLETSLKSRDNELASRQKRMESLISDFQKLEHRVRDQEQSYKENMARLREDHVDKLAKARKEAQDSIDNVRKGAESRELEMKGQVETAVKEQFDRREKEFRGREERLRKEGAEQEKQRWARFESQVLQEKAAMKAEIERHRGRAEKLEKAVGKQRNRADELEKVAEQRRGLADELKQAVEQQRGRTDELERLVERQKLELAVLHAEKAEAASKFQTPPITEESSSETSSPSRSPGASRTSSSPSGKAQDGDFGTINLKSRALPSKPVTIKGKPVSISSPMPLGTTPVKVPIEASSKASRTRSNSSTTTPAPVKTSNAPAKATTASGSRSTSAKAAMGGRKIEPIPVDSTSEANALSVQARPRRSENAVSTNSNTPRPRRRSILSTSELFNLYAHVPRQTKLKLNVGENGEASFTKEVSQRAQAIDRAPRVSSSAPQHRRYSTSDTPSIISTSTADASHHTGGPGFRISHCIPHRFERASLIPTRCHFCHQMIWGSDCVKCLDCRYVCHTACEKKAPPVCGLREQDMRQLIGAQGSARERALSPMTPAEGHGEATIEEEEEQSIVRADVSAYGVFGVDLAQVMQREKDDIPFIVTSILAYIESNGLDSSGLYRQSGASVEVQRLKTHFSYGRPNLEGFTDIHAIAGGLKLWLRELPDCLMTIAAYHDFLGAWRKNRSMVEKKTAVKQVIDKLPDINRRLLKRLCKHFVNVAGHSNQNHMTPKNLALIFGPTLLRSNDPKDGLKDTGVTSCILELLINHFDFFFCPEE